MDTYYHITIKADWNDGDFVHTCLNVNEQEKDYIVKAYLTTKRFIKEYSVRYPSRWYRQAYLEDAYSFADNLLQFDDELKGDILIAKDGSFLKQIFVCTETREEAILSSIAIFRPNPEYVIPEFLCYILKSPKVYNYIAQNCVSGSARKRL